MRKSYITSNCEERDCPKCGIKLTTAAYYTARPINEKTIKNINQEALKTTTTITTITSYTDIQRQTGKVCLPCGHKEGRRLIINGVKYFVVAVCIVILAFVLFKSTNLILLAIGIGVAVIFGFIGFSIYFMEGDRLLRLLKYQDKSQDNDTLSAIFVDLIFSGQVPEGHTALSTKEYKKLSKS